MSTGLDISWLTARPIAHRGLHDAAAGIIENTRSAVRAAIAHGYAIEVDIQRTADNQIAVFHDDDLDRLTGGSGPVDALTLAELREIPLHGTEDRIWSLADLLAEVDGRVPLVVELKSLFDGDKRLALFAGIAFGEYEGPLAAKSFDPEVIETVSIIVKGVPLGCIGCDFSAEEWPMLTAGQRWRYRNLLHWPRTRPDFLSWDVNDLPRLSVTAAQRIARVPVMSWTVRTPQDQARAGLYADQMVFEGFLP